VLYLRGILDRVEKAAPFLQFDADPYPVIADGRLVWLLDGYTTSDKYPYSQSFNGEGGLSGSFNYVRNSVKATVDAYDGTVRLYVIDQQDPVIRAYQDAFPQLFTRASRMPNSVRVHFRYPQDLFRAQTDVYRTYHMTNPTTFFTQADLWEVSPDPGSGVIDPVNIDGIQTPTTTNTPQAASSTGRRIDPIYLLVKLPGDEREQFIILRPFVPVSKGNALQNLEAFMVAKSDPANYGKLQSFTMPTGSNTVFGPVQVNSTILNTDSISERFTLLDQRGSRVVQGSLQLIPIEDSLLYIRPIYVVSQGSRQPAFRFVVVFYAGRAVIATSVERALVQFPAFRGLLVPPEPSGETPSGETPSGETPAEPDPNATAEALLAQASQVYNDAQDALRAGNFARYGELSEQLGRLLEQAAAALQAEGGGGAGSSTGGTPSTTTTSRPPADSSSGSQAVRAGR
jgi:uncharacterized membrane protein (UPF0182 family)